MQGHYNRNTNIDNVAYNIRRFAEIGVMVSITELDISRIITDPSGFLTPKQEIQQAADVRTVFPCVAQIRRGRGNGRL